MSDFLSTISTVRKFNTPISLNDRTRWDVFKTIWMFQISSVDQKLQLNIIWYTGALFVLLKAPFELMENAFSVASVVDIMCLHILSHINTIETNGSMRTPPLLSRWPTVTQFLFFVSSFMSKTGTFDLRLTKKNISSFRVFTSLRSNWKTPYYFYHSSKSQIMYEDL